MIKFFKEKLWVMTLSKFGKGNMLKRLLTKKEKEAIKHIHKGFLHEKGWWKSWEINESIDSEHNPLPWVTYSFIDFIVERLDKTMIVFEFGLGNSTLFYSSKVKTIHTVEHDKIWYEKINRKLPTNVNISFIELEPDGAYSRASGLSGEKYDIIIVDGRDRINCMLNSVNHLNYNGILILDDSERVAYKNGVDDLISKGFKKIDFWGISPGFQAYNKSTSIFYRSNNVLNI